jgi:hypothetical protein
MSLERHHRAIISSLAFVVLFFAGGAQAAFRYSYVGPELEKDANYPADATYISGYFEVGAPLPPNLNDARIRFIVYSFTDGGRVLDQTNTNGGLARVSTDNVGNIIHYHLNVGRHHMDERLSGLRINSDNGIDRATYCISAGFTEGGARICPDAAIAEVEKHLNPGSWERTEASVVASTYATRLVDITNDSVSEVALLRSGSVKVEVRDGQHGPLFSSKAYLGDPYYPAWIGVIDDLNGNSLPEISVLGMRYDGRKQFVVRDAATNSEISRFDILENHFKVKDVTVLRDVSGNSLPDVAFLYREGSSSFRAPPDGLFVRLFDASTGEIVGEDMRYLDGYWDPYRTFEMFTSARRILAFPDMDSDGVDELGVFAERRDGRTVMEIQEADGADGVHRIWFSDGVDYIDVAIGPDADDDGALEVVALGMRRSDGRIVVERRNAFGPAATTRHWFFPEEGWRPIGLATVPDTNNDGIPEYSVLAVKDNGQPAVEIRNAAIPDNAAGRRLYLDSGFEALQVLDLGDTNGNGITNIGVLGVRQADGRIVMENRDAREISNTKRTWFLP